MAHITLSVPDSMYKKMKEHPELKWSEIARRSFMRQLEVFDGKSSGKDFFESLPEETKKLIRETSTLDWTLHVKEMKEKEWKRVKSLTPHS